MRSDLRRTEARRLTKAALGVVLLLAMVGCEVTVLAPEEEVCEEDPCELVVVLEVVRAGNTYWTNELDIWDNKLGFDCRRVRIVEKWESTSVGLLLFTHETWECYDCPDTPDTFNTQAAVYVNEWF